MRRHGSPVNPPTSDAASTTVLAAHDESLAHGHKKAAPTGWSGAALVRSNLRSDAAEKVGQRENSRKPNHCAGGNAPAGFLYGFFHDHSDNRTVCQAASSVWTRSAQERLFNETVIFSQLQKRHFCGWFHISALSFVHGYISNQHVTSKTSNPQ